MTIKNVSISSKRDLSEFYLYSTKNANSRKPPTRPSSKNCTRTTKNTHTTKNRVLPKRTSSWSITQATWVTRVRDIWIKTRIRCRMICWTFWLAARINSSATCSLAWYILSPFLFLFNPQSNRKRYRKKQISNRNDTHTHVHNCRKREECGSPQRTSRSELEILPPEKIRKFKQKLLAAVRSNNNI